MPIDIFAEHVITIAEAVRALPRVRPGRKPHRSTLYRWMDSGVGGVRLEFARIGGTRVTSREALQRFVDRRSDGPRPPGHPREQDENRASRIEQELDRRGL